MTKLFKYLLPLFVLFSVHAAGQNNVITDKQLIRGNLNQLCAANMHGRGYVKNGKEEAAKYVLKKFREYKLKPAGKDGSYVQGYAFHVNTFPGKMELRLNKTDLVPGEDFIIDAYSNSFTGEHLKVEKEDLLDYLTVTESQPDSTGAVAPIDTPRQIDNNWRTATATFDTEHAYYLEHVDTFCMIRGIKKDRFLARLPKGCYIIPESQKLTWTVEHDPIAATVFHVKEDALPKQLKSASADVTNLYMPHAHCENIVAVAPGAVKDTFIAFTAHYDHLGMMGDTTVFPGASDNASGTAMLLYLASYFSMHPQHYSILFIAFSGEEAGLMGSEFYVKNPVVPLGNIKFLTNIDIMGDATDGITVVNATEYPKQYELLQQINDKEIYIPVIKARGKAANSDHYYFTEAGVPSFFIYSNGGKGFYHDIYDAPREVTLNHVDGVAKLLIDFTKATH